MKNFKLALLTGDAFHHHFGTAGMTSVFHHELAFTHPIVSTSVDVVNAGKDKAETLLDSVKPPKIFDYHIIKTYKDKPGKKAAKHHNSAWGHSEKTKKTKRRIQTKSRKINRQKK